MLGLGELAENLTSKHEVYGEDKDVLSTQSHHNDNKTWSPISKMIAVKSHYAWVHYPPKLIWTYQHYQMLEELLELPSLDNPTSESLAPMIGAH